MTQASTQALSQATPDTALTATPDTATAAPQPQDSAHLAPATLTLLAAALLAACGGGGGGGDSAGSRSAPGFNNYPKANDDAQAARFLQQSQFASTDGEINALRGGDFYDYLQQQYAQPPEQTGWDWLESRGYTDVKKYLYSKDIVDFMVWNQLFTAQNSMRKRVALALSEYFVVSIESMDIDWPTYAIAAYWDLLNANAFGNFRKLLEDITLSPAMGYFLNTRGNQKEDIKKGRQPDENYAREVMQLFTIGVSELNLDGSAKLDAQGKKIDTYDSNDVSQLARVFTGYDYDPRDIYQDDAVGYRIYDRGYARKPMYFDTKTHSDQEANFLNVSIPAGTKGDVALKIALDGLFNHPNMGPFFAKQMIQRLVTSNPSPAYVTRVASAFNNNGQGERGDLEAVWTAVLLDDEARGPQGLTDPGHGKVREPMVRFVQWGRTFGLRSLQNSWKIFDLSGASDELAQSPFHSPSVFNFFRPGYVPPDKALADRGATAPELQIVNETTVGGYINFMSGIIRDGMNAPEPTMAEPLYRNYIRDIVPNYSAELALINNTSFSDAEATRVAQSMTQRLNKLLCAGQLSTASASVMQTALKGAIIQKKIIATSPAKDRFDLVAAGVLMTLASSDYLVQK
jgi:uncharacterized protein (DUF1800 family)